MKQKKYVHFVVKIIIVSMAKVDAGVILVLFIILQIDANVIQPKLLGSKLALKPIFILISIIIGADIAGVLGMVLAVPAAALIKLFLKRIIGARIREKELIESQN